MIASPHLSVSVIIATYNRAVLLDECLMHLQTQRFFPGDEIIVVDNGSTDETASIVERRQAGSTVPLRLLRETRPGKSHAIATAIRDAAGEVLAFTDDDVNVGSGWLDAIRRAMASPSVALTGGPVVARWEATVPGWIRRALDAYPRLAAPIALLDYGTGSSELGPRTLLGANLAVRRAVFTAVGGFPTHLGKLRGTLLSGEDDALCRQVQAAGFRAVYCPDARVHHWVPAERARAGYFLRWFFWSGITHAIMDSGETPTHRQVAGLPFYLVRRAFMASTRALAGLTMGNRTVALDRAIDVAFSAGYAAQRWGLMARTLPASTANAGPA